MPSQTHIEVPPQFFSGGRAGDRESAVDAAASQIAYMAELFGREDLGEVEVLDVGCGGKFTEALINRQLPIRRYVGIDVNPAMIDFLSSHVDDPRFEYHRIDVHNDLYNPDGKPLTSDFELPIPGQSFDLICLFSVFTHLAPHDYVNMLKVLRRHIRPDGRLFFTLYIDEKTEGGHGLMDAWARKLGDGAVGKVDTFKDLRPKEPLKWALYSRRHAFELMEGTGWDPLELRDPLPFMQHHFVCRPC